MISASAVTLATRCLRRAAFRYGSDVKPAPEVDSEAVVMGKGGHSILEQYQRDGTAPPPTTLGNLCRLGLKWLPHPGQANAEGKFEVQISGVPYLGYMDLEAGDGGVFPGTTMQGIPAVCDYKFGKDPLRYGIRTPEDFLLDPQALLYAAYAFVKYGAPRVFLRWLKFQTEGRPAVYPIDAILSRQAATKAFGEVVHPYAKALVGIRQKNNEPNSFPGNLEACHDYGRPCPYLAHCDRSNNVSLLDEMRSLVGPDKSLIGPGVPEAANGVPPPAINPPPIATAPTTVPAPALRVILEELGAAFTRAAARV